MNNKLPKGIEDLNALYDYIEGLLFVINKLQTKLKEHKTSINEVAYVQKVNNTNLKKQKQELEILTNNTKQEILNKLSGLVNKDNFEKELNTIYNKCVKSEDLQKIITDFEATLSVIRNDIDNNIKKDDLKNITKRIDNVSKNVKTVIEDLSSTNKTINEKSKKISDNNIKIVENSNNLNKEVNNLKNEFDKKLKNINKNSKDLDIKIGKVESIEADEKANVSIDKNKKGYILNFKIPRGYSGAGLGYSVNGLPKGGSIGQALIKKSLKDFDGEWKDISVEIPTEVSAFNNDSGYISDVSDKEDISNKSTNLVKDRASSVKYPTTKETFDKIGTYASTVSGEELELTESNGNDLYDLGFTCKSEQETTEEGKNLFNTSNLIDNFRNTILSSTNNTISIIPTVNGVCYTQYAIKVDTSTQYTLSRLRSVLPAEAPSGAGVLYIYFYNGTTITYNSNITSDINSRTFTTDSDTTYIYINFYSLAGTYDDWEDVRVDFTDIQLEEGSTATDYEPYIPNSPSPDYPSDILSSGDGGTITIDNGTTEYPITLPTDYVGGSLPNGVADTNTQQKIGKVVLDGTESWTNSIILTNTYCGVVTINDMKNIGNNIGLNCIVNNFTMENIYWKDIEGVEQIFNRIFIRVNKSRLDTEDITGFKSWLSTNNVTVYYELATPIDVSIDTEGVETSTGDSTITTTDTIKPELTGTYLKKLFQGSSARFLKADGSVGSAIEIVDTYENLPTTAEDGEMRMVLHDTMVDHTIPTMSLDTEYERIYVKPIIYIEDFGLTGYLTEEYKLLSFDIGADTWDMEIYPIGDELIPFPYMDILTMSLLEYIDDENMTLVQSLYMYVSKDVDFWIAGSLVALRAGWTKVSVKVKLFTGGYNYYDFMINYNMPPAFEELTFLTENSEEEEEPWDNIQNLIFDETNFVVHNSGIYRYCSADNEWCLTMQSSNFKPKDYVEEE